MRFEINENDKIEDLILQMVKDKVKNRTFHLKMSLGNSLRITINIQQIKS